MKKIAIIGGGISGLTSAQILKKGNIVTVFEKEKTPGGLIRCREENGSLFYTCGGHVFNSKRKDVLDWFQSFFDFESNFNKINRNSTIFFSDKSIIPYPIENHIYNLETEIQRAIIHEITLLGSSNPQTANSLEDFFLQSFGKTLYEYYFKPYNEKIWRRNLKDVPLSWLNGKLPMPTKEEILYNNFNHIEEKDFVHSSFWCAKTGGAQFIADKLSKELDIRYERTVERIEFDGKKWLIDNENYDTIVFCGNIKDLPQILRGVEISAFDNEINKLEYHGTTSVFCEIEPTPYTWIYLPNSRYRSHRIICTGNFSENNNAIGKQTATIEFTDSINHEDIISELTQMPYVRKYITHIYNKYTYPIQTNNTKKVVSDLKKTLNNYNFYFTGRFADWEYYNMDVAIGAAMDTCRSIN